MIKSCCGKGIVRLLHSVGLAPSAPIPRLIYLFNDLGHANPPNGWYETRGSIFYDPPIGEPDNPFYNLLNGGAQFVAGGMFGLGGGEVSAQYIVDSTGNSCLQSSACVLGGAGLGAYLTGGPIASTGSAPAPAPGFGIVTFGGAGGIMQRASPFSIDTNGNVSFSSQRGLGVGTGAGVKMCGPIYDSCGSK